MAEIKTIQALNINGSRFNVKPCWEQLGLSSGYMLALLSRDEFCPVATGQPSATDTIYTDPVSGNLAGFHPGQCVIYPDNDIPDGWGLSIAKQVIVNDDGIPTQVCWFHATDIEKRLTQLEQMAATKGCIDSGLWDNECPWQSEMVWENGS